MTVVDEFLEHYGVKGMKWGVRTRRGSGKRVNPTAGYSRDAKRAAAIRRKAKNSPVKVKTLSNEEINTFLNRVNLESRFSAATPTASRRALNTVKSLLGVGKTMNEVAAFSNTQTGKTIQAGLKKKKAGPKT